MANIVKRFSEDRGYAHHGWLMTKHTFSFASYYDPKFSSFGPLRVLNEDVVKGGTGFGRHPHSDHEIYSYVVSGRLLHQDSMGNLEVIERGGVQFTSAGTGIVHSEHNDSTKEDVHFLQIWVTPNKRGLSPSYQTIYAGDEEKLNTLRLIVQPKEACTTKEGALEQGQVIGIHNDVYTYACLLQKGKEVRHVLRPNRKAYIHVCQTLGALTLNGTELAQGDGAFIFLEDSAEETTLSIVGNKQGKDTEFLLFDLPANPS